MKYFLIKLVENPTIEDPLNKNLDVHKHFSRYGKGEFVGPAIKISKTSKNITIKGSFETEDEMARIGLNIVNDDNISVSGVLMSGQDFKPILKEMGFDSKWFPAASKGKIKKFETKIKTPIEVPKNQLLKLVNDGVRYFYTFLNFTSSDKSIVLKCKSKPPQPSKKAPSEEDLAPKVDFSSLKIPFSEDNLKLVIEGYAQDFIDEIPNKFRNIMIQTSYNIKEIIFPEGEKNPKLIRINSLRKGTITRSLYVNNSLIKQNTFDFIA